MYTYTQNRILHHEDCPARSLHPWKSSQETRLLFKNFGISVDDQGNGLANKQWILVLWLRLKSVLLANQIEFLDMFWLFDGRIKNILYFREFVNQLFEVWPTCRQEFPRELGGRESRSESKKEEWRSFLSLSLTLQKWAVKRGRVMQIYARDHVEVQPQTKKEALYLVKKEKILKNKRTLWI